MTASPYDDPIYKAAIIDLLGAIGYGEISAFERMTEDAKMAPTLEDKVALLGVASAQFAKIEPVRARLAALGVDPYEAMREFKSAIDEFHDRTAPGDWWESLIKAYVGEGLTEDFYREIAGFLDEETRTLVVSTLEDEGQADFALAAANRGIAEDPKLAGRLALWGRRLMGEALIATQRVSASRDSLTGLLTGESTFAGLDFAGISAMFERITARHVERMSRLGLEH